ncbi:DFP3-like protein [Mya arenaria]|uniref:DFP3-like protein n=1 Tax=Mya arenaria TaxID=6604 RepID=A0ABY7DXJ7_MYAAR|nr:putative defense protein 3 [Mya arenaria]WAR01604.1 DFP3-like protein [Mya arenaria]
MKITITCFIVLAMPSVVTGYSAGAPSGACDSMTPNHGTTTSSAPIPYTLTVSTNTYDCNDVITVTLVASSDAFKGFLCQARPDVNTYSTVGTLAASGGLSATSNCGDGAITHSEGSNKTSAVFTWTASGNSSTVNIVCTVVQTQMNFWVKGVQQPITFSGSVCSKAQGSSASWPLVFLLLALVAVQRKISIT